MADHDTIAALGTTEYMPDDTPVVEIDINAFKQYILPTKWHWMTTFTMGVRAHRGFMWIPEYVLKEAGFEKRETLPFALSLDGRPLMTYLRNKPPPSYDEATKCPEPPQNNSPPKSRRWCGF